MNIKQYITHTNIQFIGLCMLVGALPLSKFMMSVAQFILIFNWIAQGNILNKLKLFFTNKIALVFISIYVLHIIGVFYSSDLSYSIKDLRTKIPWLIMPLIISTGPTLNKKRINQILIAFIGFVVFATLISTYFYLFTTYTDVRNISRFISHIRFSLFIDLSIIFSIVFLFNPHTKTNHKIIYPIIIIWLILFLFILQAATGIIILLITGVIISIWQLFRNTYSLKLTYKISILIAILSIPICSILYLQNEWKELATPTITLDKIKLDTHTNLGNAYSPNIYNQETENGNYIGIYICPTELEHAWNKRSKYNYNGFDKQGYHINYTLIRFLASKGLRKDSLGVAALSQKEILAIENSVANYQLLQPWGIKPRLVEFVYGWKEYTLHNNPNGNTIFQRIEYWKASIKLIAQNPLFGMGTGDNDQAFKTYYIQSNSNLLPEFRHRSHNQFLAITVSLGLFGLIVFLISILYPPCKKKLYKNVLFTSFFLIALLSMLTEDTLETQAGITFFIAFYCIFVFSNVEEDVEELN